MTRARLISLLANSVLEVVLVAACIFFAARSPHFLTLDNALNILRSVAEIGVIAFGMTLVIVAGEIDLSVGSMVALAGCLAAWLVQAGAPTPLAILCVLALGFACGGFTGWMRNRFNVPTFIISLAMMTILRGAALKLTHEFPLTPFPSWYDYIGSGRIYGVPFATILFAAVFVVIYVLMDLTTFGRAIYAVGGNAEAARLCGLNVALVRILVLAITGLLAALSGVMLSSRMMAGNPNVASGWELDVIAAVVVGGTSLRGGVGSVWGTLVGVIFIGVVANGMLLLNVHQDGQLIARGIIIVLAVLLSRLRRIQVEV